MVTQTSDVNKQMMTQLSV